MYSAVLLGRIQWHTANLQREQPSLASLGVYLFRVLGLWFLNGFTLNASVDCRQLFKGIEAQQSTARCAVRVMFLEIHNEEVKDLLHPDIPVRVQSV